MTAPVAAKKPQGAKPAQPVLKRPFVVGTRRVDRATYDVSQAQTTSSQNLPTYNADANGFLAGMYILVETTGAASTGAGTSVAFNADAPWNILQRIELLDVNSKPIIGPLTGFDLKTINKYGGYTFSSDPAQSPIFTTTTGTGTAAGNFALCLRLPVELVHRNALGSLINKNNVATFKVDLVLAASTDVYSVSPNTLPTVRVRIQQFGWMDPNNADAKGNPVNPNPPGVNSVQYWAKQTYTLGSGAFAQRLIGIDSLVRNFIFRFDAATGARQTGDNDWPDPFTLLYETSLPIQRIRAIWRHMIQENYGYVNAVETAGGRDFGIYPEPFCHDFGLKPGAELTNQYLPVSSATALEASGTIGGSGAHTLTVLVNKVVPANGDPMALVGR